MTRVSLKEAYDNKDVVAQIYAIRDIAEGAEDTANNAVSTANTASEHVDALVPQVEGAVQNANNASASAQASAQTVAGYENRLSDVELKITTAEGQILTIQGRVTALETADGQNVKIDNINDYAVGLTGNQTISGEKEFLNNVYVDSFLINRTHDSRVPSTNKVFQVEVDSNDGYTHYIAFNNGADGSRSINMVMYVSENDVAYFNLTYTAQGEKKIFTNFQKPDGW